MIAVLTATLALYVNCCGILDEGVPAPPEEFFLEEGHVTSSRKAPWPGTGREDRGRGGEQNNTASLFYSSCLFVL